MDRHPQPEPYPGDVLAAADVRPPRRFTFAPGTSGTVTFRPTTGPTVHGRIVDGVVEVDLEPETYRMIATVIPAGGGLPTYETADITVEG